MKFHANKMWSLVFVPFFQDLSVGGVPEFVADLSATAQSNTIKIVNSSSTISAIVDIINIVGTVSTTINETVMEVGEIFPCAHMRLRPPLNVFSSAGCTWHS